MFLMFLKLFNFEDRNMIIGELMYFKIYLHKNEEIEHFYIHVL